MKLEDLRINGIKEPMGFDLPYVKVSWKVRDTAGKRQKMVRIHVSRMENGKEITELEKEGAALSSMGEKLSLSLRPRTRYEVKVRLTADNGEEAEGTTFFETGKGEEPFEARWIGEAPEDEFHPVFVKRFPVEEEVESARLYVTGLGFYEAYVNGRKAGDEFFTPNLSDYRREVQYQTYDVTDAFRERGAGESEIRILTGNGWYKGRIGYEGAAALYGDRFQVLAEIRILLKSGKELVVGTDESWTYQRSEILASDNYDGEHLDLLAFEGKENPEKPVAVLPSELKLKERRSLPVRIRETLLVKQVLKTPAGETVLDFGQNFTGFVSLEKLLPKGTELVLTCGEILQQGNFYHDNYRSAKAEFRVRLDGRAKSVHPRFTFSGFRYIKVEGFPGTPEPGDFCGLALYSDLAPASEFQSSDEKLNRLYLNTLWGQKSNFLELPTDCPQRDERLGWTGDAQVFSETACFQMNTAAFFRKFLLDLYEDEKMHEGAVAGYLPDLGNNPRGASVWGDIATFLPMNLYEHYGDMDALRETYPLMKDWTNWIIREDKAHGERNLWDFGFHFGDWLAQDGVTPQSMKGGTDDHFIASIYYYKSVLKTANAAKLLGESRDCQQYCEKAERIYQAILDEYFTPGGRLSEDTQTAYLLSLRFGVYRDKAKLLSGFRRRLKKDCYKIKGGFVGATMMLQTLAEHGMGDMAYYLLFQNGFPGWFHCIDLGATTIWERWNSVLDDGSISGTGMNSLNHYSYGSVMEYVYRYIAGIQPEEPGFASVRFAPQLNWRLSHLSFSYDSAAGRYESGWEIHEDGRITVRFTVPFGCSAVASLPGTNGEEISLTAGTFEKTYQPVRDFRLKFSGESRLEELAEDTEAMVILQEELPIAYGMARGEDGENLSLTLEEMKHMPFLGFQPEAVERAISRISLIRAF